jgi:hypothetical protein
LSRFNGFQVSARGAQNVYENPITMNFDRANLERPTRRRFSRRQVAVIPQPFRKRDVPFWFAWPQFHGFLRHVYRFAPSTKPFEQSRSAAQPNK